MLTLNIAMKATPEERMMFEKIKKRLKKRTSSELLRYLIQEKHDSIFCQK